MRTLATIRRVESLTPIENADRIEVCNLKNLGWKVIVKKGELKKNDLVVFFEIDSAIPVGDEKYEFLRESSYKCWKVKDKTVKECFRLKTRKLKGVVSQGLVLPMNAFVELKDAKENDDVTAILHIEHYDEINEQYCRVSSGVSNNRIGNAKGSFPSFCTKSDQTRIQNLMNYFEDFKDVEFVAESKYDGASCTIFMVDKTYDKDQFGVCSRNYNLKRPCQTKMDYIREIFYIPKEKCYPFNPIKRFVFKSKKMFNVFFNKYESFSKSDYWNIVNKIGIEENMRRFFEKYHRNIAVQAEMVGPGINSDRDKYEECHLFVFDVFDVDKRTYLDADERHEVIAKINSLGNGKFEEVDTIKTHWKVFSEIKNLDDMLKFVDRKTLRGNPLEGVVFKSINHIPYFSFKCINNKYLLNQKD